MRGCMPYLSLFSGLPRGAQANQRAALKDQSESSSDRSLFPVFGGISGLQKTEFLKIHRSLALGRNKKTETETEVGGRIHRIRAIGQSLARFSQRFSPIKSETDYLGEKC